jgi:L-cysteine desulfidase
MSEILNRPEYPILSALELKNIVKNKTLTDFYKHLLFIWKDDLKYNMINLEKTICVIFDNLIPDIDMININYHVLSAIDEEEEEKNIEFSHCFTNIVRFIKRNKEIFIENKEEEEFLNKLSILSNIRIAQQLIENGELY